VSTRGRRALEQSSTTNILARGFSGPGSSVLCCKRRRTQLRSCYRLHLARAAQVFFQAARAPTLPADHGQIAGYMAPLQVIAEVVEGGCRSMGVQKIR